MSSIAVPVGRSPPPLDAPRRAPARRRAGRARRRRAALVITVLLFSAAVALAGFDAFEVWGLI